MSPLRYLHLMSSGNCGMVSEHSGAAWNTKIDSRLFKGHLTQNRQKHHFTRNKNLPHINFSHDFPYILSSNHQNSPL